MTKQEVPHVPRVPIYRGNIGGYIEDRSSGRSQPAAAHSSRCAAAGRDELEHGSSGRSTTGGVPFVIPAKLVPAKAGSGVPNPLHHSKWVIASTSPDSQDICNPGAPGPPTVTARRSKTDVAVSTVIPQKPSIFLGGVLRSLDEAGRSRTKRFYNFAF